MFVVCCMDFRNCDLGFKDLGFGVSFARSANRRQEHSTNVQQTAGGSLVAPPVYSGSGLLSMNCSTKPAGQRLRKSKIGNRYIVKSKRGCLKRGSLFFYYRIVNKNVKKKGDASPSKAIKYSNLRHAI